MSASEVRKTLPRILEVDDLEGSFAIEDADAEVVPLSVTPDDLSSVLNTMRLKLGPTSIQDEEVLGPDLKHLGELKLVTRQEVAQHLREAIPDLKERPCINGDECEGLNLVGPRVPIILREHVDGGGRPQAGSPPSMCILCKRRAANWAIIQDIAEGNMAVSGLIQHACYVDVPGEYSQKQCLIGGGRNPLSVITAVPAHCRAFYQWVDATATTPGHFVEAGYTFPENDPEQDFGPRAIAAWTSNEDQDQDQEVEMPPARRVH